jgi:hypothetical protein
MTRGVSATVNGLAEQRFESVRHADLDNTDL